MTEQAELAGTQRACPKCGYRNRIGVIFCEECGTQVGTGANRPIPPQDLDDTAPFIPIMPNQFEEDVMDTIHVRKHKRQYKPGTSVFEENMILKLQVQGASDPLFLRPFTGKAVIFGRFEPDDNYHPEVDLIPYGAHRRGISRRHMALTLSGKRLEIRDLNSSNGTFLNEVMLDPKEPHQLRDGDRIRLGNITFLVTFQSIG